MGIVGRVKKNTPNTSHAKNRADENHRHPATLFVRECVFRVFLRLYAQVGKNRGANRVAQTGQQSGWIFPPTLFFGRKGEVVGS